MSTQSNDQLEELDDETADQLPESARKRLRQLEKIVKEQGSAQAELDRYKLKDSLRTNKMDLDDDQLTALLAVHKGESTPEAMRATAERLKFVEPIPATDPADENAHKAIDAARNGAGDTAAIKSYEEEVEGARNMQELAAIAAKYGRDVLERNG